MRLFYKQENKIVYWDSLIEDINNTNDYNPYCKSDDYYYIFKQIIISMLYNYKIILLDNDFSDNELFNLVGYTDLSKFEYKIKKPKHLLKTKTELINKIKTTDINWDISLFTSGTTGQPKRITHNFNSITRFVKYSEYNKNNIWGFAYNATHMAGLQVFLQSLLNGNPIVNLFLLSKEKIFSEILNSRITHISATPTFYKLLLPCNDVFTSVKRITYGGEKFSNIINSQLIKMFPNAKITNIYASTEVGTLFASENEVFSIKSNLSNLIKIEDNELIIHKSLMGKSELNIQEWYKTGDLVEVVSKKPLKLKIIARKNDMINVGGYKINPNEVEDTILLMPEIKNARVFSKKNSVTGNIVCCEVVCNNKKINDIQIRYFLQSKLQEYKIPRIFIFTDEIKTTRTGKIKRI